MPLRSQNDLILYNKIDEILWVDWDPIGIRDMGGPSDEYRGYVPQIFNLVIAGAGKEEIADKLLQLERDIISIEGPREYCLMVADKILEVFRGS